ncbi:MAG: ribonuclease P protein component [Alphaproteobacteria bacterium]|nr:ribonuclease P protein component [Alphaproteobacteria bacterium]MBL7098904.1 ribonuclease P protein component [Alphaproteobacteria bacterium]
MDRLKNRADFLRAARGIRRVTPGLTLEISRSEGETIRVGFTASRKIGGAVVRNRAKRRLRAVAAAVLPLSGQKGTDYVLVARRDTVTRPFESLKADLAQALSAAHLKLGRPGDVR